MASQRLEGLRLLAYSTSPRCTAVGFANGTATNSQLNIDETWTIVAAGTSRTITETVTYKTGRGTTHSDVLTTVIEC